MAEQIQSAKHEGLFASSITLATNASTSGIVDTIGWDYAHFLVTNDTGATNKAAFVQCQLTEGTEGTSTDTAIVAFTGGTSVVAGSTGFVIPAMNTDEPTIVAMNVDLRKRERFIKLTADPSITAAISGICLLTRGREAMPGSDDGSASVIVTG